jgi:hypothetical protein
MYIRVKINQQLCFIDLLVADRLQKTARLYLYHCDYEKLVEAGIFYSLKVVTA